MIHTGDCVKVMAGMDAASVDAIVTDPPYGLGFMGKEWDTAGRLASVPPSAALRIANGFDVGRLGNYPGGKGPAAVAFDGRAFQQWSQRWATEAFRVARPGAYLLAFGGTRTYHRMTCAIEDAGWIIRDCLVWAYASGFPKSKALLKPAWEPIVMARKPGPLRELAIDACRIGPAFTDAEIARSGRQTASAFSSGGVDWKRDGTEASGRWPANVILTDPIFDGDTPGVVGGGTASNGGMPTDERGIVGIWHEGNGVPAGPQYGDTGTYSRFFLVPKSARSEREPVLPSGLAARVVAITEGHGRGPVNTSKGGGSGIRENRPRENVHPTVKPLDLMRHLVRLVTPTGGVVLDPFLGSGTTAIAAEMEGFGWLGIEREAEYVAIAEARLNGIQKGLGLPA